MGTSYFKSQGKNSTPGKPSSALNLTARAFGAPAYAGRAAGVGAAKDIAAAKALSQHVLKPSTKTAASNAPGPKKV